MWGKNTLLITNKHFCYLVPMRRPLILFGDLSNGGVRAVSELEREFSEVEEGTLLSHVKAAREGK